MSLSRMLLLVSLLLPLGVTQAAETSAEQAIRNSLAMYFPDMKPDSIMPTPVEGLYEVVFGPRLVYITADGRFLLRGSIIDLKNSNNVTAPRINAIKAAAVDAVGEANMIIYEPDKARYTISVFTDIDCVYCRKLHSKMADYLRHGIRIRYLFYPRTGLGSESFAKAEAVWCAEDRQTAMTRAKRDQAIDMKTCPNPVRDHLALGQMLNIHGTPALVLQDGEILPGYVPPARLAAKLAKRFPAQGGQ